MVTFEAKRGQGDLPAFTFVAQAHGIGYPHVVEEDFIEGRAAAHLLDRPHLDTWQVEWQDERGLALVLRRIDIASSNQLAPLCELGAARPDLLTVDDPLVAILDCSTGKPGQVAASVRFAE